MSISWEGFFDPASARASQDGGEVLSNPTNGSSYWLTQVQTQQVASNQLRAIENGRWVLQVAPTGFSAIVDAEVGCCSGPGSVSGRCSTDTVTRREGRTIATVIGPWPVVALGAALVIAAWILARRPVRDPRTAGDP